MAIASLRPAGSTTVSVDTFAGQEAAIAEPGTTQSMPQTAASTSLARFVPLGGLHPVVEQAGADASLVKNASDAAVQGAGAGVGSGGSRPMHDIAFHPLSNTSSNDLH